jgi:hypothetical protein
MGHAVNFVRAGGSVCGILPEGARLKMPVIDGVDVIYSELKQNRFQHTTIAVVFAKWQKPVREGHAMAPQTEGLDDFHLPLTAA